MLLNTYLLDYLERDGLFYSLIWRLVKIVSFLQVKYILFHPVQNSYLKKHFHHTWGNWGRLSWILYLTQAITALNTCSSLRTFSSSLDIISMSWLAGSNMNSSLSITCLKFSKKKKKNSVIRFDCFNIFLQGCRAKLYSTMELKFKIVPENKKSLKRKQR